MAGLGGVPALAAGRGGGAPPPPPPLPSPRPPVPPPRCLPPSHPPSRLPRPRAAPRLPARRLADPARGGRACRAAACAAAAAAAAACAPALVAPPAEALRVWGEPPPAPRAHWAGGAKVYAAEPAPVLSFLKARTLGLALLRHGLLAFAPLLERWAEDLRDQELEWERRRAEGEEVSADEELDWPPFPDPEPAARAAARGVAWEGLVTTTRRLLEHAAAARAPPRLAWKLLKNVPESAVRKGRRFLAARRGPAGGGALAAATAPRGLGAARAAGGALAGYYGAVCRATARGNCLGYLAEFLARGTLDAYLVFLRPLPKKVAPPPFGRKVRAFVRCLAGNATSILVCFACASACTAVGALAGEALLGGRRGGGGGGGGGGGVRPPRGAPGS